MEKTLCRTCLMLFTTLLLAAAPANAARRPVWSDAKEAALQALAQEISGSVVYESRGVIYRTDIGDLTPHILAGGTFPRWSPDGQYVAYLSGHALLRVPAAGGTPEPLAYVKKPRAIAYHPDGQHVLFTEGSAVKVVNIGTRQVAPFLAINAREIDVSNDGLHFTATVGSRGYAVVGVDFSTGVMRRLGMGCSASISPEGTQVTNNTGGHKTVLVRSFETGQIVGAVSPRDRNKYDNQYWSNSSAWITAIGGSPAEVFVQNVRDNRSVQVTAIGGCKRADLFIR